VECKSFGETLSHSAPQGPDIYTVYRRKTAIFGRRFPPKIASGTPDGNPLSINVLVVPCAEYRTRLLEKVAYLTVSSQTRN